MSYMGICYFLLLSESLEYEPLADAWSPSGGDNPRGLSFESAVRVSTGSHIVAMP
jgi:hypothetical protein